MDNRILQVGIEVKGKLVVYDGLNITVRINKSSDSKQNTCEVTISNLLTETIDYLVTETSPWNPNKKPKVLTVLAGRQSTGVERIFLGDIISSTPTPPPNRTLVIKAQTLENTKYKWASIASAKTIQLSELCRKVADSFGIRLRMEANDKTVSNYCFNGPLAKQVNKLEMVGDIDVYVDDDHLVVKNLGKALLGQSRVVSMQTGMVGVPMLTEKGVRVRTLYDPMYKVGMALDIQSEINKAANGQYVVFNMSYLLANRGPDWYIDQDCNNQNIRSIAEKREAERKRDAKPNPQS